jgi:hypothetical protein
MVALVAGGASLAESGVQNVPCERPFVFRDAAVNVVVLPYESAPELPSSADTGAHLAGLLQLEILRSIAKFGSVGAVQVVGSKCDPNLVVEQLLGKAPGAATTVRPGHGLIVVWGRFYRQDGTLFVQTFCRLLRSGIDESLDLVAGGQAFSGRLSAQAFACAPRKVTTEDLRSFERQFYRSTVVRRAPDESASGTPMPPEPVPYWISDIQQDWMRIDSEGGHLSGWVRLSGEREAWSLTRWLPELAYVEGMAGYLRYRIAGQQPRPVPGAWMEAATRALAEYERSLEPQSSGVGSTPPTAPPWRTALAFSVQLQLRGMLHAAKRDASAADRAAALDLFERATALLPHDSDARNLVAIMRLSLAFDGRPGFSAKQTATDLLQALGTDPANPRLLANLQSAYQALVAESGTAAALTDDERQAVSKQLAAIKDIRSRR